MVVPLVVLAVGAALSGYGFFYDHPARRRVQGRACARAGAGGRRRIGRWSPSAPGPCWSVRVCALMLLPSGGRRPLAGPRAGGFRPADLRQGVVRPPVRLLRRQGAAAFRHAAEPAGADPPRRLAHSRRRQRGRPPRHGRARCCTAANCTSTFTGSFSAWCSSGASPPACSSQPAHHGRPEFQPPPAGHRHAAGRGAGHRARPARTVCHEAGRRGLRRARRHRAVAVEPVPGL